MKKLVSLFLCVTLVFSIFAILPVNTFAATSDFSYEVLADGTAALKKYEGSDANVKIPATIAGYTISSIGDYAFCFYQDLKNVEIPETIDGYTVQSIANGVFAHNKTITTVVFSDSLENDSSCSYDGKNNQAFYIRHPCIVNAIKGTYF